MARYNKNDPASIQSMFGSIAKKYDRVNSLMSFGFHNYWNKKLVSSVLKECSPGKHLDLCCGTGEIAIKILDSANESCEVFFLDFSQEMLDCAKKKTQNKSYAHQRLHFLNADAQEIPLPSESLDSVTIAYGIRNVLNTEKCIKEVFRVLRPGGCFAILELTQPKNPIMKLGHNIYSKGVLPLIGKCAASNREAYQYLSGSIRSFIPPEKLESLLIDNGFAATARHSLSGGIAAIILGKKRQP